MNVSSLEEVDAQVALKVEVLQREGSCLLRKGDDLPHRGDVVALSVDELRLPAGLWTLHGFFPKPFEFRNVVVANVEVRVPVVNLVRQHEGLSQIHGPLAGFNGGDEVALNRFGFLSRGGGVSRSLATAVDRDLNGVAAQDPAVGVPRQGRNLDVSCACDRVPVGVSLLRRSHAVDPLGVAGGTRPHPPIESHHLWRVDFFHLAVDKRQGEAKHVSMADRSRVDGDFHRRFLRPHVTRTKKRHSQEGRAQGGGEV